MRGQTRNSFESSSSTLSDSIVVRATGHIVSVVGKFRPPALLIPKTSKQNSQSRAVSNDNPYLTPAAPLPPAFYFSLFLPRNLCIVHQRTLLPRPSPYSSISESYLRPELGL